jgi:hypothetical protein
MKNKTMALAVISVLTTLSGCGGGGSTGQPETNTGFGFTGQVGTITTTPSQPATVVGAPSTPQNTTSTPVTTPAKPVTAPADAPVSKPTSAPQPSAPATAAPVTPRYYTSDQPDEISSPTIHFAYLLPVNATDKSKEWLSRIMLAANSANEYLKSEINYKFRFDTYKGAIDVTYLMLPNSDKNLDQFGDLKRNEIERELKVSGLLDPGKRYVIFYQGRDGVTPKRCADSPGVGDSSSVVTVFYIEAGNCNSFFQNYAYLEQAVTHELIHNILSVGHTDNVKDVMNGEAIDPHDMRHIFTTSPYYQQLIASPYIAK